MKRLKSKIMESIKKTPESSRTMPLSKTLGTSFKPLSNKNFFPDDRPES